MRGKGKETEREKSNPSSTKQIFSKFRKIAFFTWHFLLPFPYSQLISHSLSLSLFFFFSSSSLTSPMAWFSKGVQAVQGHVSTKSAWAAAMSGDAQGLERALTDGREKGIGGGRERK